MISQRLSVGAYVTARLEVVVAGCAVLDLAGLAIRIDPAVFSDDGAIGQSTLLAPTVCRAFVASVVRELIGLTGGTCDQQ